jgi:transcriptional regulator of acetoin/glycerol metabolism
LDMMGNEDQADIHRIGERLKEVEFNSDKPYVAQGWKRCIKLGTDPYQGKCTRVLKGRELDELLEENRELINFAKPFMESLYSFVSGSGFAVVLADKRAHILEIMGDSMVLKNSADQLNFVRGACWDEKYVGNTATGTAAIEGKPVQINGDEHFCTMHRVWGCSAAPIYSTGEIVGVISVCGFESMVHPHTLGMVAASARAIETKIEVEVANSELRLQNKYQQAVVESISDGLLTIDNQGCLTYINEIGADILNIDRSTCIGSHISTLVDFKPVVLDVLKSGRGYIDKEFIMTSRSGARVHFVKTAVPIKDENGNVTGVVDIFRKIKRVQKMVNDMVGAYANFTFNDIVGNSESLKSSIRLAKVAGNSSSSVLIQGESGTGKELFAHSIHNASNRREQPFITVNCAAIPRELIESELFGYEGGAFTGALKSGHPGKFELANGGTIFLDEIGDMPLDMQAKLLRVLQEKQISRVGGANIFNIDVRIISATNKNLLEECNQGNFRRDLYYRLNVLNIEIPPLRERRSDIEELVYHFINKLSIKLGKDVQSISQQAMQYLVNYNWPGNAREVQNIIERAINISRTRQINARDLPSIVLREVPGNKTANERDNSVLYIESIDELEKRAISNALEVMRGNISQAADALKVSRNTLYNKIKKYGLL